MDLIYEKGRKIIKIITKQFKEAFSFQVFLPEENGPTPSNLSSRSSRSNSSLNLDQIGSLAINVKEGKKNTTPPPLMLLGLVWIVFSILLRQM
jgi:hypothetical protein